MIAGGSEVDNITVAMANARAIVVMGVSGSGKTTIGVELARRLGCEFHDGDDYHPTANVEKMSHGIPLDDDDRWPWLDRLRTLIESKLASGASVVVACSALKKRYRERLAHEDARVLFAYLRIDPSVASGRVQSRKSHYMPASLIESQFAALEEPEGALILDACAPVQSLVGQIMVKIGASA